MSWPAVDLYGPVDYDHATRVGRKRRRRTTSTREIDMHVLSEEYESLDYEIIENQLYKQAEDLPGHHLILWKKSINRWVICFIIGVLTALVASMIDVMVTYSAELKFKYILTPLFESQANSVVLTLLCWIALNCGFVFFAAAVVLFFAGPVASGSGIPQIKCFLNGVSVPGVVKAKTLIAKACGVAFSVAGGLSVGKEGPMIHSGAVIAAGVSQGRATSFPLDLRIFEYFRNDREKRDFVSAGAAAGVAAAFGAPIGGVLFSLEEGASFWNQGLTWRIFFASMISSFTLSAVLSLIHGQAGILSWSGLANFGTFKNIEYNVYEIFFYLVMGGAGGLLGAAFNHINYKLTIFRMHYVRTKWQKLLEIFIVASVSAMVAFMTIFCIDDCAPLGVNPNITEPIALWCPDGSYSAVAELYMRTPEESVKMLFHSPAGSFRPVTLGIFTIGYFLLTTWTYGLQVPSGLFIPSLLTGAAGGRLVGIGIEYLFPDFVSQTGLNPGKYALAGAAAMLGGVVRMTISLTAIIMEATRDITFGLPIMLILMMAKWIGDYFNEGLYDIHIQLAGVPLLGWEPPRMSANILAKEVMCPDVNVLSPIEKVGKVYDLLTSIKHHGFPVVQPRSEEEELKREREERKRQSSRGIMKPQANRNAYGKLMGLVLRQQLVTLLQHRMFCENPECDEFVAGAVPASLADFTTATSAQVKLEHLTLMRDDRECYMDLRPYMNPTPYRVPVDASLSLMFQLFRGLGLRNLMVVDSENELVGCVTRKDLARFREKHHDYRYKVEEIYFRSG